MSTAIDEALDGAADEVERLRAQTIIDAEQHCNHDPIAIRDGRCECGVYVAVPGGRDGLVLAFGEGTDDDTINLTIGKYFSCVVGITMKDGRSFDITSANLVRDVGELVLTYKLFDNETGYGFGDFRSVPFDDINRIEIY